MDFYDLKDTLKTLQPGVAQRRIEDIKTNVKLLHAMPFNGNHVGALCDVLQSIVRKDTSGYLKNLSVLEEVVKRPSNVIEIMITFLKTETPITDDELLQTICFLSSHNKIKALKKDTFTSYGGESIYKDLTKLYESKDTSSKRIRKLVDTSISDVESHDREVIYFLLTSGNVAPPLAFDIDRVAKRCDVDIVRLILEELPGTPLKQITDLIKGSPSRQGGESKKVKKYTTKLAWLLRLISAHDAQTFIAAVNNASARLAMLPRHIARNYTIALEWLESSESSDSSGSSGSSGNSGNSGNENAQIVNNAIYENS
ncbi:uncharacterized protein PG986_008843 [Apiospora aurea]|uniref:Uncharacterized protein n=1 Tax=Apiospora aurea TaxID=335848 RepID=A0ABR1Q5X9_9PEZI